MAAGEWCEKVRKPTAKNGQKQTAQKCENKRKSAKTSPGKTPFCCQFANRLANRAFFGLVCQGNPWLKGPTFQPRRATVGIMLGLHGVPEMGKRWEIKGKNVPLGEGRWEGSAGVSEGSAGLCGVLRGSRDLPRFFGGSDPMLVTLRSCWS